nr:hypothetical protein [Tanacetum cinerariifolium]
MTEPNNPLFEDEKEFLERKKLEYERALRGDVEEIKEQTIQVGKVALVGAGVVGGVWLLVKAFSSGKAKKKRKHKKAHKHEEYFEDYAGFDGFEEDDHEQELYDLTSTYHSPEYAYDHADRYAVESDGFYQAGAEEGADYLADDYRDDADDNGLNDYPDFPAHSSPQHGADDVDTTYGSHAAAPEHLDARPYDDSRRLPESNSFAEDEEEPATASKPKKSWLVPAIISFAQSETGKVVLAQVAAVAMAFISSKVKDILPSNAADANKNADLAASSAPVGASPEHVVAAPRLRQSGLQLLPTGYMLVDSGRAYISGTMPLPHDKPSIAAATAMAGEQLGLRLMYLDGGSGAQYPVSTAMIRAVRAAVDTPLIVGGGLNTSDKIRAALAAGADLVVVGNHIERDPQFLAEAVAATADSNGLDGFHRYAAGAAD